MVTSRSKKYWNLANSYNCTFRIDFAACLSELCLFFYLSCVAIQFLWWNKDFQNKRFRLKSHWRPPAWSLSDGVVRLFAQPSWRPRCARFSSHTHKASILVTRDSSRRAESVCYYAAPSVRSRLHYSLHRLSVGPSVCPPIGELLTAQLKVEDSVQIR